MDLSLIITFQGPEDWWLNLIKTKFKVVEIDKTPKRLKLLLC